MKKFAFLSLFIMFTVSAFSGEIVMLKDYHKLVGPKRIPHKKLSPSQTALKSGFAFVLCYWKSYSETLPEEKAAKWRLKNENDAHANRMRENALRHERRFEIISVKQQKQQATVVMTEDLGSLKLKYNVTLQKTAKGWIVTSFDTIEQTKK